MTAHNPDPIEIEPRPCVLCGCHIDGHEMIDDGDGPLFFCADDDATAATVQQWEMDDPRDRWRHTGEPPPPIDVRNGPMEAAPPRAPEAYYPAGSTIDAFRFLIKTGDAARARAWLADRPKDAPLLLALLESTELC